MKLNFNNSHVPCIVQSSVLRLPNYLQYTLQQNFNSNAIFPSSICISRGHESFIFFS